MSASDPAAGASGSPTPTAPSAASPRQDRRGFLRRSIAILPAAALAASEGVLAQQPVRPGAAAAPATPAHEPYVPRFFNAAEWAFIHAAVARLIPADDSGPGAVEAGVPEFIDRQLAGEYGHAATWYRQGPFVNASPLFGFQAQATPRELYRMAIAAIDAHCRGRAGADTFAQLAAGRQDELLAQLEAGTLALEGVPGQDFFGFLLQNTKEGYFSDPMHGGNKQAAAWKMIGFPGARADYADWVGRPGVRYNLPPVGIHGPQA